MRLVSRPEDLAAAIRGARSEAGSAFADSAIYFEKQIVGARHVEIQLLGDEHGTVVPFVERECSIQRRHQKVVEETPSVAVGESLRRSLADAAAALARSVGYTNAGTIEFLLDQEGRFYFLEMNTRLQVEHPVTEMVTGVDLVHWQIRIARGERLTLDPARTLDPRGHAVECRVYAEDPDAAFLPSPGLIRTLHSPAGPGIRLDGGVAPGFEVPVFYDSMLSKVIAWGADRREAISRMIRALGEYEVGGVKTTIPVFLWLLREPDFLAGRFDTTFLDRVLTARNGTRVERSTRTEEVAVVAAALHAFLGPGGGSAAPADACAPVSNWKQAARLQALRQ
jgi:acetyl-CoA carboxylase biotin carboxylase subunit